jgi:hypothetical protein
MIPDQIGSTSIFLKSLPFPLLLAHPNDYSLQNDRKVALSSSLETRMLFVSFCLRPVSFATVYVPIFVFGLSFCLCFGFRHTRYLC